MSEIVYCETCDKDQNHETVDINTVECMSTCQVCDMETTWIKMSPDEFNKLVDKAIESFKSD